MTPIEYLDQQVKQACQNATGVSIGRWDDKSTWRVTGSLTASEQASTRAIFNAFDLATWVSPPSPLSIAIDNATTLVQLKTILKQILDKA